MKHFNIGQKVQLNYPDSPYSKIKESIVIYHFDTYAEYLAIPFSIQTTVRPMLPTSINLQSSIQPFHHDFLK